MLSCLYQMQSLHRRLSVMLRTCCLDKNVVKIYNFTNCSQDVYFTPLHPTPPTPPIIDLWRTYQLQLFGADFRLSFRFGELKSTPSLPLDLQKENLHVDILRRFQVWVALRPPTFSNFAETITVSHKVTYLCKLTCFELVQQRCHYLRNKLNIYFTNECSD